MEEASAAQGLLSIASVKGKQRSSPANIGEEADKGGSLEGQVSAPIKIAAFRPIAPRIGGLPAGRIITSGNTPPVVIKAKEDAGPGFRPPDPKTKEQFYQPKPRRPEPQERVTLIVAKPREDNENTDTAVPGPQSGEGQPLEDSRKASFDLPIPPSAFAMRGRVSGAESIGARTRRSLDEERESYGNEQFTGRNTESGAAQPPFKRARLDRTISAALQQVDERQDDAIHGFQASQELTPWSPSLKRHREVPSTGPSDTMEIAQKIWGGPPDPVYREKNIMPRNSSDKSTLEIHKQLAEQCSGEMITSRLAVPRLQDGQSAELDPNIKQHPSALSASTLIGSAPLKSDVLDESLRAEAAGAQPEDFQGCAVEPPQEEDQGAVVWTGQIKHRLKTASGSSVAELFSLHAQIPSKLMEQFPPTIFVNVLVGRANVKLGKHYVASCRLANPTERQISKVRSLASMKLVAICELQHCTVTLVPYMGPDQSLRLVAFLIADE